MKEFNQRYLDFCIPFIQSIKKKIKTMVHTDLVCERPMLKENSDDLWYYTTVMGLNGKMDHEKQNVDMKGSFAISFLKRYLY